MAAEIEETESFLSTAIFPGVKLVLQNHLNKLRKEEEEEEEEEENKAAAAKAAAESEVASTIATKKPLSVGNQKKPSSSRAGHPSYSYVGASRMASNEQVRGGQSRALRNEKYPSNVYRSDAPPSSPKDKLIEYALSNEGRKLSDPHSIPQEVRTAYYELTKKKIYEAKRNYDAKQRVIP